MTYTPNNAWDRSPQTGLASNPGPFLAEVMKNDDPLYSGRLLVYIPDFGGDPEQQSSWHLVRYMSPYYGIQPLSNRLAADSVAQHESYGMWMAPPDLGVKVLVMFINGDRSKGVWIGCLPEIGSHGAIPGNDKGDFDVFANQSAANRDIQNIPRPEHSTAPTFDAQGLADDAKRGKPITTSSLRESPTKVFGFNTPSGHSFFMDDGDTSGVNKMYRLRTAGGNMIMMNDDEGFVYIINAKGTGWIEISPNGFIDIYGEAGISMATKGNINMHAEGNISMHSNKNLRAVAEQEVKIQGTGETKIYGGRLWIEGSESLDIHSCGEIKLTGSQGFHFKSGEEFILEGRCFRWNSGSALEAEQVAPDSSAEISGYLSTVTRAPGKEPWVGRDASFEEDPRDFDQDIISGGAGGGSRGTGGGSTVGGGLPVGDSVADVEADDATRGGPGWTAEDADNVEALRSFSGALDGGENTRAQLTTGERAYAISRGYIRGTTPTNAGRGGDPRTFTASSDAALPTRSFGTFNADGTVAGSGQAARTGARPTPAATPTRSFGTFNADGTVAGPGQAARPGASTNSFAPATSARPQQRTTPTAPGTLVTATRTISPQLVQNAAIIRSSIPNAESLVGELAAPLTSLSGLAESIDLSGAAGILGVASNLSSAIESVQSIANLTNVIGNLGNLGNVIKDLSNINISGITDVISGNLPISIPTDLASIIPPDLGNVVSEASAALQNLDLRQAGTNIPDNPISGSAPASAVGSNCGVPTTRGSASNSAAASGASGASGAAASGTGGPPGADLNNISGVSASDSLLEMLIGFEGYGEKINPSLGNHSNVRPYWDFAQWSIGFGSYAGSRDRSRRPNIEWTPEQAKAEKLNQLVPYRRGVEQINSRGNYQWTAEQLDALTSFAYNIGSINQLTGNATRSNREIADAMLLYNKAGGAVLPGLAQRRRVEQQKFLAGMAPGRLDYNPGRLA